MGKTTSVTPSRRRNASSPSFSVTPARENLKRSTRTAVTTPASTPRLTKRELQRQNEKKNQATTTLNNGASCNNSEDHHPLEEKLKKENGCSSPSTTINEEMHEESSLHEEFLEMVKKHGLEKMASQAGLMNEKLTETDDSTTKKVVRHNRMKRSASDTFTPADQYSGSRLCAPPSPDRDTLKQLKKRRGQKIPTSDKNNKGLRHFSMKVCQKVQEKQLTSYNEVADELVHEFVTSKSARDLDQAYDEKNIRRRVYDALNVLMAMDIISKEKKEIRWKGLPSNAKHDLEALMRQKQQRLRNIEKKKRQLEELLVQHISFKKLVNRNSGRTTAVDDDTKICLPFIIVSTNSETVIQCEMSEDRQDIFFNFSEPFEINDDNEVLRRMGMQKAKYDELKHLVPEHLIQFLPAEYRQDAKSTSLPNKRLL